MDRVEHRLDHIDNKIDRCREELCGRIDELDKRLNGRMDALSEKMDQHFRWLVGITAIMWSTAVGAMIALFVAR